MNLRNSVWMSVLALNLAADTALAEDAKPKIGMLLPLSGSYAMVGNDNRNGIDAALKGSEIQLRYADSKAETTESVSEFQKLVDSEGVLGVYAMRGPVGMALKPLAKSLHIPLLGGVGNRDFVAQCAECYQLWSKSDKEGAFLASKVLTRKLKTVALITGEDDVLIAVSSGFRETLKAGKVNLAYDQNFNPADTDFRAVIVQLKLKKPDALFVNLALPQIGPFLKQAREGGLKTEIYSNQLAAKTEVREAAGAEALGGVRFVEMNTDLPNFKKKMAASGLVPSSATLSSYAATLLIQQAIESSSRMNTKEDLLEALAKQTELKTPDGPFPIEDRVVVFPLVEKQLVNGKAEVVASK